MTVGLPYRSERLLLRELVDSDRAAVREYRRLPEVSRYLSHDFTDPGLFDAWWSTRISGTGAGGWFALAVELEGRVIGDAGLKVTDAPSVNGPTGEREGSLGYAFHPEVGGRGYGSETCAAVLRLGFEHLRLRRITAEVFGGHHASSRILAKNGLRHEGTSVGKVYNREGGWYDDEHWAMLRSEWESRP